VLTLTVTTRYRRKSFEDKVLVNRSNTARVSLTSRAALTNDPLRARADGRTPQGRRIRDLFRAYSAAMGSPNDPGTQAAVLAAAELVVAAERARAEFLADGGDVEQLIRLENLAARATRRLGVKPSCELKAPTIADHLARRAKERSKRGSA
jgi:hypothetical protein